jgi:hypothetical protein
MTYRVAMGQYKPLPRANDPFVLDGGQKFLSKTSTEAESLLPSSGYERVK